MNTKMPHPKFFVTGTNTQSCGDVNCKFCDYKGNFKALQLHLKYTHHFNSKEYERKCPHCSFVTNNQKEYFKHDASAHRMKAKLKK